MKIKKLIFAPIKLITILILGLLLLLKLSYQKPEQTINTLFINLFNKK